MSQTEDLHNKAMDLAAQAIALSAQRLDDQAIPLFKLAFENEVAALRAMAHPVEPTRSVLLRSAATLALRCHETEQAEKLAAEGLSGNAPSELADELRDVFEQANFHRHLQVKGTKLDKDELQISLSGHAVGNNMIDVRVLNSKLESLCKLVHRTIERKSDRQFRTAGRVSKKISDSFGPYVSVGKPGSYVITLKLGSPKDHQPQLYVKAEDVLNDILNLMSLIENADRAGIAKSITDPVYRNNFIALTKQIAPDGENISHVGFTSLDKHGERAVSLSRPSFQFDVLEEHAKDPDVKEDVEIAGKLLFADATKEDNESIRILQESGNAYRVTVPKEFMNDIVRPLWGHNVVVKGAKRGNQTMLTDITLDES